ncbi:MAG: hypothetical protein V3V06_03070 [Dehalococcoidia bacterium]
MEFLRVEGGSDELAKAIRERNWTELSSLSDRERALCVVADKMSGRPTRMVEEDWQPLRDLGFEDTALLEVAHIVGLFNYLTRLADGFGLQVDPDVLEASQGSPLHRSGSE